MKNSQTKAVIMKLPEVLELTKISRTTLYRLMETGEFPRPIKLGQRARAWRVEEVTNWLDTRAES